MGHQQKQQGTVVEELMYRYGVGEKPYTVNDTMEVEEIKDLW